MDEAVQTPVTLSGLSSMATRQMLAELAASYARETGSRVEVTSVGGVEAARRVQAGEAFDFVVLAADAIERLAAAGKVDGHSRVDVARSGVAIAVAAGAVGLVGTVGTVAGARPDIGTEAAVREAVLSARRIGYSTGPSGTHLKRLFERWGITGTIAARIVEAPPGVPVGALIASGEVDLGFQQASELMHVPGIVVLGPLPASIQTITVFSAAVCRTTHAREATTRFLSWLASPAADGARRAHGMEAA